MWYIYLANLIFYICSKKSKSDYNNYDCSTAKYQLYCGDAIKSWLKEKTFTILRIYKHSCVGSYSKHFLLIWIRIVFMTEFLWPDLFNSHQEVLIVSQIEHQRYGCIYYTSFILLALCRPLHNVLANNVFDSSSFWLNLDNILTDGLSQKINWKI